MLRHKVVFDALADPVLRRDESFRKFLARGGLNDDELSTALAKLDQERANGGRSELIKHYLDRPRTPSPLNSPSRSISRVGMTRYPVILRLSRGSGRAGRSTRATGRKRGLKRPAISSSISPSRSPRR